MHGCRNGFLWFVHGYKHGFCGVAVSMDSAVRAWLHKFWHGLCGLCMATCMGPHHAEDNTGERGPGHNDGYAADKHSGKSGTREIVVDTECVYGHRDIHIHVDVHSRFNK